MYEVCDISFDDVQIEIQGIHCGSYSGTAGVDSEGAVCSLVIDGFKDGDHQHLRLDVQPHKRNRSWDESFAVLLGFEIEKQMKDEIREALIDWADHAGVLKPDFEVV